MPPSERRGPRPGTEPSVPEFWHTSAMGSEDGQVVRYLDQLLAHAVQVGASDLHFEPYEHLYRVRIRVDGLLRSVSAPPVSVKDRIASRIKILARLDISEKRLPQDGRMRYKVQAGREADFRVSTLPTLHGEKVVLRLLDAGPAHLDLDALGYEPEQKALLAEVIHRPWGMVLMTGPTGSGKTLSLYSCLRLLNQEGRNISTAEDPSEINLSGLNQVNIHEKAGLTFGVALRAFLRQDPDVIMIGEIRDLETADLALKAAQTGHLLLSTLHTNDAPGALVRLRHMGLASYNIAASLALVTAQRLVRRLCPHCRRPQAIARATLLQAGFRPGDLDGSWQPYGPVGCEKCHQGFRGRTGIFQVMPITEAQQSLILREADSLEVARQAAREGVLSLREAGLRKVKLGWTSLEEIFAHTHA